MESGADEARQPEPDDPSPDSPDMRLPVPNPRYTLPARRLAGSPACLNCGTALAGPFCHYCGQPDRNLMRFFPVLLRDFLEDFLDLDSRFMRTIKPLLFHPGRLTRDYLEGRRFRYTPPMRLYLFTSIVFFVLAALLSVNALQMNVGPGSSSDIVTIQTDSAEEAERLRQTVEGLPEILRNSIEVRSPEEREEEFTTEDLELQFNDEPWDRETNPLRLPLVPDAFNEWINDEIEQSPEKAREINENPRLIVEKILDLLPATIFVMLPVVALIFKFWYLFARRYYIEHLILALHNHAFIFLCLTVALLLELLESWAAGRGLTAGERIAYWSSMAVGLWIPVYLVASLRTVYRQGWFLTLAKGGVIGISYLSLLTMVTTVVALLGFLLL
jgi:hypothetical protein